MSANLTISRTELARSTRQTVEQARHGQTIFVKSYGEEQVAIVDALDYRLLRAVAAYRTRHAAPAQISDSVPQGLPSERIQASVAQADGDSQVLWDTVTSTYLDGDISLGRAAELLKLSRFELTARFNRLGLPLHLGPATLREAQDEIQALNSTNA
jgi:predicted HTH domain antitoxin